LGKIARHLCDDAQVGLDWNDLRFFLAIHRARTLAGASRTLGVEHTTVGRRLTAMENALGTKLFVRTPDGFSPTTVSHTILVHAEQVEAALVAIERIAHDDDRPEGLVRLTTSETFAGYVGRRLGELRARHPKITVEVLSGNANLDLTRREADLALRIAPTKQPELLCRSIAKMGWSLYAARGYVEARGPVTPSETLRGHDVIGFNDSLAQAPGALWFAAHADGANVVLRSGSIPAALNAALGGLGVVAIPCFLGDAEPTLVRLMPDLVGERDMFLVVHPDLAKTARVRVVMDFFIERFAADADVLAGVARTHGTRRKKSG
jgi:DNA-binding transcriptional LysR family regulator